MEFDQGKFKEIIMDSLGVDMQDIKPKALLVDDLGADSLDCVELCMSFEEEYAIDIPDEDAEKIKTVGDAEVYLNKRISEKK